MQTVTFSQDQKLVGKVSKGTINSLGNLTNVIRDEPMLFSSSPSFASQKGGTLTNLVLGLMKQILPQSSLEDEPASGFYWVIDTRVHMLMKGQFPAIPGWHGDAVPRPNGPTGQPDFNMCDSRVEHYAFLLSDHPEPQLVNKDSELGISSTAFLRDNLTIKLDDESPVWGQVDRHVHSLVNPAIEYLPDREIWKFGQLTLHNAQPTTYNGWRFFFRMSKLMRPARNEIRRQVQVYTTQGLGW